MQNHKNIGFPSDTGPDPLKITKLSSEHSMLGHHWHASETPLKWCFAGGPTMARLLWYLDCPPTHQLKNVVKVGPPLTKLSGSAQEQLLTTSFFPCKLLAKIERTQSTA